MLTIKQELIKPLSKHGNITHTKYVCICDCGKSVTRTQFSLKRSKSPNCGCTRKFGKELKSWKGVGDISRRWFQYHVERAANGYYGYRKSKEVDITIEYIWELFLAQNKKCAYTSLDLQFPKKSSNKEVVKATASLDRIDSTKGYIKGNIQWVHKTINLMKNTLTNEEFISFCKLVAENEKLK